MLFRSNYRMTNIAAAIGFAQIEHVHWHLERRHEIAGWYREALSGAPGISFQGEREWAGHAHWMITILVEEGVDRDQVMARLLADGIETRPAFFPIHTLPPYRDTLGGTFPVAEDIGRRGISLPTWAGLTPADVRYIAECLARAMSEAREDDE